MFWWSRLWGKRSGAGSRKAAKERLMVVLNTDRSLIPPERLQALKAELVAVISKYVPVDTAKIEINIEQRHRDNWLVADVPLVRDQERPLSTGLEDA